MPITCQIVCHFEKCVPALSVLEDRVTALIGRDAGPSTGVRRDAQLVAEAEVSLEILYLYIIEAHNKL